MTHLDNLMSLLDDSKSNIKEGCYIKICKELMEIKEQFEQYDKQIRRYKRTLFQKGIMTDALMEHITDNEYDSDTEQDIEIYLNFGAMP
jgi:hypothetical protein